MPIIIDEHDELLMMACVVLTVMVMAVAMELVVTTSCLALQPRWAVIMALLYLDNYSTVGLKFNHNDAEGAQP